MGCDIHIYPEYFDTKEKKWKSLDSWVVGSEGTPIRPSYQRIYDGRNYELFGILTNGAVRRDVSVGLFPVVGLPKNVSEEVKTEYSRGSSDYHNATFVLLSTLDKFFEENTKIKESAYYDKKNLKKLKKTIADGKPDWDLRYPNAQGVGDPKGWEWAELEIPAKDIFSNFLWEVVDKLKWTAYELYGFGKNHEKEFSKIRLVFWFDN